MVDLRGHNLSIRARNVLVRARKDRPNLLEWQRHRIRALGQSIKPSAGFGLCWGLASILGCLSTPSRVVYVYAEKKCIECNRFDYESFIDFLTEAQRVLPFDYSYYYHALKIGAVVGLSAGALYGIYYYWRYGYPQNLPFKYQEPQILFDQIQKSPRTKYLRIFKKMFSSNK